MVDSFSQRIRTGAREMTTPDIAGLCERLRAALEGVTPGDLDTSDHIGSGNYNCPCCEGEGAVEGKTFTNFDGFAIGVQFFGVGDEFAKYEAFFRAANPQTVRALLDTLERQAAEIERLRATLGYYSYADDGGKRAIAALTGEDTSR
jgi:hypothetical protein